MKIKKIQTSTAEIHVDADGILHVNIARNTNVTLVNIKEN
jgi:hypothetical protein